MLKLDRFYTSAFSLFLGFDSEPNILLNYGKDISLLASEIGAQIVQLPVTPQAASNVYRLALVTDHFEIKFSFSQIEATVKEVQEPGRDSKMSWSKLQQLVQILETMNFLNSFNQQFVGLFSLIRSPQSLDKTPQKLTEELFENLTGHASYRAPVSVSWQMGFLSDDHNHYINYNVKTYQTKQVSIEADLFKQGQPLHFDIDSAPMVEHGIELVLDINNRPKNFKSLFSNEIHDIVNLTRQEAGKVSARMIGR